MKHGPSALPAIPILASLLIAPATLLAQPEIDEPEPTPELCPCACSWECCHGPGVCDFIDFVVFANAFSAGDPCAIDKDTSTGIGVGDILDFIVFQQEFVSGMFGNC